MYNPRLNDLPPPPPGKTGWPWTEASPWWSDTMSEGKPMPRVSIITPSYNQQQFIEEAIRSVLLQGYPNLEYVIMDGGSADGSVDIIRKYAPWLDDWVSEPDGGQADAINRGLKRTTGESVAWLNSDDTYLPGTMLAVADTFAAHPDVGLIFGDCNIVDEETRVLEVIRARDVDLARVLLSNPIPQPAAFFRRQALDSVGVLDPGFRYVMDHEFWVRVGRQHRMKHVPRILANFRMHRGSKSVSELEGFLKEYITIFERAARDARTAAYLPASVSEREGLAHYNLGVAYYGRGEMRLARQHFVCAARLYSALIFNSGLLTFFAKTLLGRRFTRVARRWRNSSGVVGHR